MSAIAGANATFALELTAAIGIEGPRRVLLNIRRALLTIEHVVGRDMNQRDTVPRRFPAAILAGASALMAKAIASLFSAPSTSYKQPH